MKLAYADPPYVGCAKLYDHPEASRWDDPAEHIALMHTLDADYEAWALSLHTPSLRELLGGAPDGVRVAAWVKPFASYKRGVDPAYTWEPLIYRTARKWSRDQMTVRDHHSANITLQRGLAGVKPESFCFWLFDLLGATPDDDFTDLFHGSGAVTDAWAKWCGQSVLALATPKEDTDG